MFTPRESWKMFDQIAGTYDKINRILSFGMDRGWRKSIQAFLPQANGLCLLDLATGTGDQLFSLMTPNIEEAVGLDLSQGMLKLAREKGLKREDRHKIQWILGDAQNIPFEEKRFDVSTFSFGIRNVESPPKSLQEIFRVLKPKGRSFILEFSLPPKPIRPFYLFYLRHLLPRIGGTLSSSSTSYRYLNETIEAFPSGKAFCKWMEEAGFQNVYAHPMALGAVTLYRGDRP